MHFSARPKIIVIICIVFAVFLAFGIASWVFFSRPPVLIVTDASFSLLYGPERLERQSRRISLSYFRQVIQVPIDEKAAPENVAIAVQEASEPPWAAIFPYRYIEGARRYKRDMMETPVLVVGGPRQDPGALTLVTTDTEADIYLAGMAAAMFTGEKQPLFFSDGTLSDELREIFRQGLEENGCLQEPVFQSAVSIYPSYSEIGCVVVSGPAARFAEQNLDIPVILFSWMDPSMTPETVKLVFDDSLMAMAIEALKDLSFGEVILPSSPTVFRDRVSDKGIYSKLNDIIRKK